MKHIIESIKFDYGYARSSGEPFWSSFLGAMAMLVQQLFAELVCKLRGHNLEVDFHDPENGREDIGCKRCGWCETVYW